jgi:hypothetical protein
LLYNQNNQPSRKEQQPRQESLDLELLQLKINELAGVNVSQSALGSQFSLDWKPGQTLQ